MFFRGVLAFWIAIFTFNFFFADFNPAISEKLKFRDVRETVTTAKSRFRKYLSYSEFLNESIERLNRDFIDEMKTIEKLSEKEEVLKAKYRAMKIDDDFVSHLELLSKKYAQFYNEVDQNLNNILNMNIKFNNIQEGDFFSRLVRSIEEDHEKILVYYSQFKEKEKFIKESSDGLKEIFEALVVERGALVYKDPENKINETGHHIKVGKAVDFSEKYDPDKKTMHDKKTMPDEKTMPDKKTIPDKKIVSDKKCRTVKKIMPIKKNRPGKKSVYKINKISSEKVKKSSKKTSKANKLNSKISFTELAELNFSSPAFNRPICIMIENHRAARPQSGLELADIVFEMLAEGGITRFMAVIDPEVKGLFGPVRSCRHYFTDFVSQFDAIYAHCGSSNQGLLAMKARKIKSINEIKYGRPFYRVKFRKSPHNLYCRSENIFIGAKKYGLRMKTDVAPPKQHFFRRNSPLKNGKHRLIRIKYHKNYSVSYLFNESDNKYYRTVNNKPHIVYGISSQLRTSNIIIIRANTRVIDSYGRLDIDFSGSGKAIVYFGGEMISGKWVKDSPRDIIKFYDENDREIEFNPGNIWVQVVKQNTKVSPL